MHIISKKAMVQATTLPPAGKAIDGYIPSGIGRHASTKLNSETNQGIVEELVLPLTGSTTVLQKAWQQHHQLLYHHWRFHFPKIPSSINIHKLSRWFRHPMSWKLGWYAYQSEWYRDEDSSRKTRNVSLFWKPNSNENLIEAQRIVSAQHPFFNYSVADKNRRSSNQLRHHHIH